MRFLPVLWLLLLACAGFGTSYDATSVNVNLQPVLSVTSTESTFIITLAPGGTRYVQITGDQAWGISDTTTTFANKYPLQAYQPYTIKVTEATKTWYVQASSTTANLHLFVVSGTVNGQ